MEHQINGGVDASVIEKQEIACIDNSANDVTVKQVSLTADQHNNGTLDQHRSKCISDVETRVCIDNEANDR